VTTAQELVAAGDPQGALQLLQQQVRTQASDAKLRIFLFQLLCVLGQWQRALTQLNVCGELDAGSLAMVNTYREALQCEAVREAVFAGKTTPHAFGQPQAWVALLAEALQAEARGDAAAAASLRAQALNDAPPTSGAMNGEAFEWITDADSRIGPVLEAVINGRYCWVPFTALAKVSIEAPVDLRDLVWSPAGLEFINGGATVALIPTRYCGSSGAADSALQMARKTEWIELGTDQYRGLGQRVFATSASDVGVLEAHEIVLNNPEPVVEADEPAA
jgi:type VI secretion system protein ImpE